MTHPEYHLVVGLDRIGTKALHVILAPDAEVCANLARRFDLVRLADFTGEVVLVLQGQDVRVTGQLKALPTYNCRVSNESYASPVEARFDLLFRTEDEDNPHAELELAVDDLDIEPLGPHGVDVGEVAAQSLSLALDPWPRAPDVDAVLPELGIVTEEAAALGRNPFAKLKGLI